MLDDGTLTDDEAWSHLRQRFSEVIELPGELPAATGRCRRAALVGPTGVGKTTTVAKLAADFQLRRGCQVGLITVDTFRVGAVEQLQAYADLLAVPMRVVSNAEQMRAATAELATCDWVLIDTIGRSPHDVRRIESLQHILQAAELDHLLLTLSASSDPRTQAAAVQGFTAPDLASETALILTKIDECQTLAPLYPQLRDCGLPWRYWTQGQNVPEDLGVAADDAIAWFLDEIPWHDQPTWES
jgi:flagellar biosynthesis protein FlhF